ncbi:MAG: M61 family metallopeptidase, partial [Bacteroidia bacterium]|nr:M61 family metallopeptidase [Bacteroidia bacterium]
MYVKGKEDKSIQLEFSPLSTWKHVEAALPNTSGSSVSFEVVNYDLLADSPIALGNFDISTYETAGVPHRIVMMGKGNYDLDKVTEDFKKISDEEVKMFGGKHPCERYTHFIQNVESGGGGLEHLNCQTSQVNRWAYTNSDKYRNFLGLISHEYFHLWNVKRIRPYELGPFDYEKENYTDMLWVAEGITSYFDDLFLKRAGIHSTESYLAALAGNINRLENQPGKDVMSLDESSKLAWVKAYLSNENSKNVTISYYNKGMLVAWMLDLEILTNTNGKKRLDDVLQILFDTYYTKEGRGFTHKEFIAVCEKVAGKNMDDFFMKYVFQKDAIPYSDYLAEVGIDMEDRANGTASIGVSAKQTNGKLLITYVHPDGSGVEAGLSVNDEIIAINNWRVGSDLSDEIARLPIGSKAELLYNRDGLVHSTMISIKKSPAVQYRLSAEEDLDKSVQKLQDIWLN